MFAPPYAEPDAVAAEGLADLRFAVRAARTRLTGKVTRPPLLVQRALYLDDALPDLAFVILSNPTAGVFSGDRLRIAVHVDAGAKAHVTTQAATKVHAMRNGSACQTVSLEVDAGAYLEYLPDPVIPFRDAAFHQATSITVQPGGTLIYGDILLPGRTAMGERLAYTSLSSSLTLHGSGGYPRYREAFSLTPCDGALDRTGLLGRSGAAVLGTLLVVTDATPTVALRDGVACCVGIREATVAVSVLPFGNGVVLKALGRETSAVQGALTAAWSAARHLILGVGLPERHKS